MKHIHLIYDEKTFTKLVEAKGEYTWEKFMLKVAGVKP